MYRWWSNCNRASPFKIIISVNDIINSILGEFVSNSSNWKVKFSSAQRQIKFTKASNHECEGCFSFIDMARAVWPQRASRRVVTIITTSLAFTHPHHRLLPSQQLSAARASSPHVQGGPGRTASSRQGRCASPSLFAPRKKARWQAACRRGCGAVWWEHGRGGLTLQAPVCKPKQSTIRWDFKWKFQP